MGNKVYIVANLDCAFYVEDGVPKIVSGKNGMLNGDMDGYIFSQIVATNPEIKETDFFSIEDLQILADTEYEKQEALSMALEIMDKSLSDGYRREIAVLLTEQFTAKPELVTFVQNRLLSTPLPEAFSPQAAREISQEVAGMLVTLYEDLEEKAKLFAAFYTLFVIQLNLDSAKQKLIDFRLTDEGSYTAFVIAMYKKSKELYESATQRALLSMEKLGIFQQKTSYLKHPKDFNNFFQAFLKL